jgi:hypothetical protein
MTENKKRRSPAFALIVGIGFGLLIALVKKKIAMGLLIGLIIAAILYKRDRR